MKLATLPSVVLVLCLGLAAAAAAGQATETVAGLPLHVQKLDDGVVRVWIGDHISSTATVAFATREGIIVVDTTGNPAVDRELRRVIARELGRDDFAMLINTHEHRDHTGGNAVYADCEIVGHALVAEGMQRQAGDNQRVVEWLTTRTADLETEIAALPADAPEAARLREQLTLNRSELQIARVGETAPAPTRTFDDRLTLDCGDLTFELSWIGGMHSASDIAVFVPAKGILLTGDTMADVWLTDTPGCLASFIARQGVRHDFPRLLANWNALAARKDEIRLLVTGHWNGELTFDGFAARVAYIEALWNATQEAAAGGADLLAVVADNRLADRFPALVNSPGCSQGNNATTIQEMWKEATGQQSAAEVLYGLIEGGADEAAVRAVLAQREAAQPEYFFIEAQINGWGYRFLQSEHPAEAVAMFRINVELFPDSWNVYDSLGEALLAVGDVAEAEAMYTRSVELNPESPSGLAALERIRGGS